MKSKENDTAPKPSFWDPQPQKSIGQAAAWYVLMVLIFSLAALVISPLQGLWELAKALHGYPTDQVYYPFVRVLGAVACTAIGFWILKAKSALTATNVMLAVSSGLITAFSALIVALLPLAYLTTLAPKNAESMKG